MPSETEVISPNSLSSEITSRLDQRLEPNMDSSENFMVGLKEVASVGNIKLLSAESSSHSTSRPSSPPTILTPLTSESDLSLPLSSSTSSLSSSPPPSPSLSPSPSSPPSPVIEEKKEINVKYNIDSKYNVDNKQDDKQNNKQDNKQDSKKLGEKIISEPQEEIEPLLALNENRFVIPAVKKKVIWDMYKKHQSTYWTAEEIDLVKDKNDWKNKLNNNEKYFFSRILSFFAGADGIVNENLAQRFMTEIQVQEARCFYGFQIMMENIHSEVYTMLIDTYIDDELEKKECFDAISTLPTITRKAKWAQRWTESKTASFAERLVAFAIVEGVFFSGAFCSIFWLKKRGLMPGFTFSNELISRDEALHCEFACLLYSMLRKKLTPERIEEIFREAVEIEKEFIIESIPVALIGMNSELMSKYIEFVADRLMAALGYKKIYHSKNPFDWMEMISLQGKTNFFEKQVGDYQSARVKDRSESGGGFTLEADF